MAQPRTSWRSAWSWWGLAFAGVPLVLVASLLLLRLPDYEDGFSVPCEEALGFARAELPEQATDAECESYSLMDRAYRGTFRMPRAAFDAWVERFFPDREVPHPYATDSCDVDLCVRVERDPKVERGEGAYLIGLSARHDADGASRVEFDLSDY